MRLPASPDDATGPLDSQLAELGAGTRQTARATVSRCDAAPRLP